MSAATQQADRLASAVVGVLADAGVRHVFGIPGLHTLGLYAALAEEPRIRHVTFRHESGAAFAADGYARVSGDIGVVTATTGPGVFNTLGALSEADLDGSPVLLLAGQIATGAIGAGRGVLHETEDQAAAFAPACGVIERPRTGAELVAAVSRALDALRRPGARPAYVELPLDLLDATRPADPVDRHEHGDPTPASWPVIPDRAVTLLAGARRPVVVAGGGVVRERATAQLMALAERLEAPVLHSVPGRGAVPLGHRLDAGPLVARRGGAASLLADADVVLVGGDRLDDQTTASASLRLGDSLIHLAERPAHLDRGYRATVGWAGSIREGLDQLVRGLGDRDRDPDRDAGVLAADTRAALRASLAPSARPMLEVMDQLRHALSPDTIVVSDAASIDSWTAFFWPAAAPGTSLFPWGSAALGFGLPAGIGASLAAPSQPVVVVCGDGGFLFTIAELGTAAQVDANVTVVVADDEGYGSIAAYQRARGAPELGTRLGHVDLAAAVAAHGIPVTTVRDLAALPGAVRGSVERGGPGVIHLAAAVPVPW